jgi:hypothetical protein
MAEPEETLRVAAAAESYAARHIACPQLSRVDLARDSWAPGLTVDVLEEHLDRGELTVEAYRPPCGRGVTVQGIRFCDRLRVYDRGFKTTGSRCTSSVWRVEAQLNRLHIPENRRTIDLFRRDMPMRVTIAVDDLLLRHGLNKLVG